MSISLLALLDDITAILDDVSVMAKVAAQKTVGVLGDDLALNAQQLSGVASNRELPVVWAVAKGSFINKAILVPAALLISAFAPWAVTPLLMVGGAYLCLEGFEKVAHRLLHSRDDDDAHHRELAQALADPAVDLCRLEKDKIKGAVRTDFILSAEIIAITLGIVAQSEFAVRLAVLAGIAVVLTIGVYGAVACIVKLDDLGLYLTRRPAGVARAAGRWILLSAPWLMKALTIAGTAAMFLVGGGIIAHGLPFLQHAIEGLAGNSGAWARVVAMLLDAGVGLVVGAVVLAVVTLAQRMAGRKAPA